MENKTVKELRALAKARGIQGYSKLSKEELVRRLKAAGARAATPGAKTAKRAAAHKPARRKPETSSAPTPADGGVAPAERTPVTAAFESTEQLVEEAKYALRPKGAPAAVPAADLDEDIDRLPPLAEPVVTLLPQKPDILHAYWRLPPGDAARRGDYKLRLCRTAGDALVVQEEVPAGADRGHWYFHLAPERAETGGMLVQLGYYDNGRFQSAGGRSIARLPSLYASGRTDQRWWIDEAGFLRMYLRGGGFVTPARRFGWAASIGSPAPATGPEERLSWPGGVGSPFK